MINYNVCPKYARNRIPMIADQYKKTSRPLGIRKGNTFEWGRRGFGESRSSDDLAKEIREQPVKLLKKRVTRVQKRRDQAGHSLAEVEMVGRSNISIFRPRIFTNAPSTQK